MCVIETAGVSRYSAQASVQVRASCQGREASVNFGLRPTLLASRKVTLRLPPLPAMPCRLGLDLPSTGRVIQICDRLRVSENQRTVKGDC